MKVHSRIGLTMFGAGLLGCGADQITTIDHPADFRILHATAALGPVDVEIGGRLVAQGITFGRASAVISVPGGQQHIVVRAGSQIVGQLDVPLSETHLNTVVVAGGLAQLAPVIQADTGRPAANRANIRLVNIATQGPNPNWLDVKAQVPGVRADSVMTFGLDAAVSAYWTLMYFDAGHFDFTYLPRGGSTVLAHAAFEVALGEKKALVLERTASGGYQVTAVVEP